jgi:uncharacterized membrane protein
MKNKILAALALGVASMQNANAGIIGDAADEVAAYSTEIGTALLAMVVVPLAFVGWKLAKRVIKSA